MRNTTPATKGKKKFRLTPDPYLYESVYLLLTQNPIQMEKMHPFKSKISEGTVLTFITAILYFCAIMAFAYLFTMSQ